jgi:hypothetical protein
MSKSYTRWFRKNDASPVEKDILPQADSLDNLSLQGTSHICRKTIALSLNQ